MAIEVASLQDLATLLRQNGCRRIGIDGVDGCGKTTLAKNLGEKLEMNLISLDDYLNEEQGGYLNHLRYEDVKKAYCAQPRCIVEGVCLLQVLEAASLEIDTLVYVKRMDHGLWADERECDIGEDVDSFLEKERQLVERFAGGTAGQTTDSALPRLAEEIIRYHASYRPFEKAAFWYRRDDC
jgi:hypothetical protein